MKEISCIQQYVIDSLMNNNHLVIDDILSAISMICSEEKLQEIDKISSKAESLTTQPIVRVSLKIPGSFYNIGERHANRIKLVRIIKESTSLDLKDAKDFADLVKESVILQYQEVIKLRNALKEYGIKVCIIQQLYY